jgi:hypothetical protein
VSFLGGYEFCFKPPIKTLPVPLPAIEKGGEVNSSRRLFYAAVFAIVVLAVSALAEAAVLSNQIEREQAELMSVLHEARERPAIHEDFTHRQTYDY